MTAHSWLPNFFIAGVPKAGTTSLPAWIADHPDAFGSLDKETCYFADADSHIYQPAFNAANGLEDYSRKFPVPHDTTPRVIFESAPAYICQATALHQIPKLVTNPHCLFVLREPAAQIASIHRYYQNNWSMIPADMGLAGYMQIVRDGSGAFQGNELAQNAIANAHYLPYLQHWHRALGPERIKVMTFDALSQNPKAFTQKVAVWLGLNPGFYDTYAYTRENESYQPHSRALQRINIAVRGLLPKGRLYRRLRGLYRRAKAHTATPSRGPASPPSRLRLGKQTVSVQKVSEGLAGIDRRQSRQVDTGVGDIFTMYFGALTVRPNKRNAATVGRNWADCFAAARLRGTPTAGTR